MSISSALNAALSGLTASSRRAEAVSTNIANASTPGFARRTVGLAPGLAGGILPGVRVLGATRQQDIYVVGLRREAEAGMGQAQTAATFWAGMEEAVGLPGNPGSLTDRITRFEQSLIEASSRPDSNSRLQSVLNSAESLTDHLNQTSARIQDDRLQADRDIAASVDLLNSSLEHVKELNTKILQFRSTTRDVNALMDQRQIVIDRIAELLPVKQIERPNGVVALYTPGGAVLVDSKASEFGFTASPEMTAHRTLAGGGLSGLSLNGRAVTTGGGGGLIGGGKLSALFDVRDSHGPQMQAELDAIARNLIERFEDPAVDPTLGAGSPGLFTDNGAALNVADELALASRISVNVLVDPGQGGEIWRLRDGLGAAAAGDPGNAALLNAMTGVLSDPRVPASGSFLSASSLVGMSGDLLSFASTSAFKTETEVSYARATFDAMKSAELQDGVDTDQEMQELLLIEQSYAANAQMMAALDEMMQQLLRL